MIEEKEAVISKLREKLDEINEKNYNMQENELYMKMELEKNPKERVPCRDLLQCTFIRKYRDLETCEELCQ